MAKEEKGIINTLSLREERIIKIKIFLLKDGPTGDTIIITLPIKIETDNRSFSFVSIIGKVLIVSSGPSFFPFFNAVRHYRSTFTRAFHQPGLEAH